MSSTDFHEFVRIAPRKIGRKTALTKSLAKAVAVPLRGPHTDTLGASLLGLHLAVGVYILGGWAIPNAAVLTVYDVFVPLVMLQWVLNQGSCVLNYFESRLRYGSWHCEANPEEGGFVRMLSIWWFGYCPSKLTANAASYAAASVVWLLGLAHLYWIWA